MKRWQCPVLALGIREIAGERRTVYIQLDGSVALADECSCAKDPFTCPINKHALSARNKQLEKPETAA
jgi:hypothetical protein